MSDTLSPDTTVIVVSSDGEQFTATLQALKQSVVIGMMLEVLEISQVTEPISFEAVDGSTLKIMLKWCEHHREDQLPQPDDLDIDENDPRVTSVPLWDALLLDLEKEALFKIANGATYLEIPKLQRYACCTIAQRIRGMTTLEMRQFFDIQGDFTPEQEEEVRQFDWRTDQNRK